MAIRELPRQLTNNVRSLPRPLGTSSSLYSDPLALLQQLGYSKPKEKVGVLERLSSLFNTFQTAPAVYQGLKSGSVLSGVGKFAQTATQNLATAVTGEKQTDERQKTYKDVLTDFAGMKDRAGKIDPADVLGLIGDIAGDPTTYLGVGTAGKLSKLGQTAQKTAIKGSAALGREAAEAAGKKAVTELGEKGVQKGGQLMFAGRNTPINLGQGVIGKVGKAIIDPVEGAIAPLFNTGRTAAQKVAKAGMRGLGAAKLEGSIASKELTKLAGKVTDDESLDFFNRLETGTGINPSWNAKLQKAYDKFAGWSKQSTEARVKGGQPVLEGLGKQVEPVKRLPIEQLQDMTLKTTTPIEKDVVKSKGHVGFFNGTDRSKYELYKDANGELFRAPVNSVIDVTNGYRIGRWEAPAHMADAQAKEIMTPSIGGALSNTPMGNMPAKASIDIPKFVGWHGSDYGGQGLKPTKGESGEALFFSTQSADSAETYGRYIHEAEINIKNPFVYEADGKDWFKVPQSSIIKQAKQDGYDSVIFKNIKDSKGTSSILDDIVALFDKKQADVKGIYDKVKDPEWYLKNDFVNNQPSNVYVPHINEAKVAEQVKIPGGARQQPTNLAGFKREIQKTIKEAKEADIPVSFSTDVGKVTEKMMSDHFRNEAMKKTWAEFAALGSDVPLDATSKKFSEVISPDALKKMGNVSDAIKDKYFDPETVNVMNKHWQAFTNDEATKGLLGTIEKVNSAFKQAVTAIFPAFHMRNAATNTANTFVALDLDPIATVTSNVKALGFMKDYALKRLEGAAVEDLPDKMIDSIGMKYSELFDTMVKNNLFRTGYAEETMGVTNKLGELVSKAKAPLKKAQKVAGLVGNTIEDTGKTALFIGRLGKGDTVEQAADQVRKWLFDYSDLTPFEKNVMKNVMPFYTWMKKNVELQLTEMAHNPGRYAMFFKVANAVEGATEGKDGVALPSWLKQGFTIPLGTKDGQAKYITGFGSPLEALETPFSAKGLMGSLSPLLKAPIELTTGKNIFKGVDIAQDTSGNDYRNAPKWAKDILGVKENKQADGTIRYTMPPMTKYALSMMPMTARSVPTIMKLFNISKGEAQDLLPVISGVKTYSIDEADQAERAKKDEQDAAWKKLQSMGIGATYTKQYIPKASRSSLAEQFIR